MGEVISSCNILLRKSGCKKPRGIPNCRLEDNIKVDKKERGWEGVDRVHLAQCRAQWLPLVNTIVNLWVPYKTGNLLTT
jgi:hypothetical protein